MPFSKTLKSDVGTCVWVPITNVALLNAEATDTPPEASTTTKAKVGDYASDPEDRRLIQEEQNINNSNYAMDDGRNDLNYNPNDYLEF